MRTPYNMGRAPLARAIAIWLLLARSAAAQVPELPIVSIVPTEDSLRVIVAPYPGAKDYRIFMTSHPEVVKYSAGNTTLEFNGVLGPCCELVVEAVDQLGPFEKMIAEMPHDGLPHSINGHGPPTNVPVVLARSRPFPAEVSPRSLRGTQTFFETFKEAIDFARIDPDPGILADRLGDYFELQSARWHFAAYSTGKGFNRQEFNVFRDKAHFMTVMTDYAKVAYATLAMRPRHALELGGADMLHATMEVDAHMSLRRWTDIVISPAGDRLVRPDWRRQDSPVLTESGRSLVFHVGNKQGIAVQCADGLQWPFATYQRMRYPDIPTFNGRDRDIDLRRRFDIFLSRTRFVAMEEGKVLIDAPIYRAIPAGRYQVHFLHHLYHSINDHMDLKKYSPFDILWLYRTPYYDVRHWDNMGIQVVRGLQDVFDDSIPPLVVLSTPKTGEIVRGNVHVFATAHDNLRVVRCELWVDGRLVRTQRSGIDTKWNSNTAANGPHSLRVTAYDDSGNAGFSSVATVVVRN